MAVDKIGSLALGPNETLTQALARAVAVELWRTRDHAGGGVGLRYADTGSASAKADEYAVLLAVAAAMKRARLCFTASAPNDESQLRSSGGERGSQGERGSIIQMNAYETRRAHAPCARLEICVGLPSGPDLSQGILHLIRSRCDSLWVCSLETMRRSTMPDLLARLRAAAVDALQDEAAVTPRALTIAVIARAPALVFVARIPVQGDPDVDERPIVRATEAFSLNDPSVWVVWRCREGQIVTVHRPMSTTPEWAGGESEYRGMEMEPSADFSFVLCPDLSEDGFLLLHNAGSERFDLDGCGLQDPDFLVPECTLTELLECYVVEEVDIDDSDYVPSLRYREYWRQRLLEANQTL